MKFDKDGWLINQKIKSTILHSDDHDRLYYEIRNSEYTPYKHISRNTCKVDLKHIPLNESNYKGEKFKEWNVIDSGALALIGKSTKTGKTIILKILIPKKSKK